MMPLDEVLIHFAVVGGLFTCEVVGNVGFLKQDVAVVLLIVQNLTNGLYMPHGIPSRRGDPVFFQFSRYRAKRQALSVPGEYRTDDLGACRVWDELSVLVVRVSVTYTVRKTGTAVNVPRPEAPTDVIAFFLALVLVQTRVDGQQLYRVRFVDMDPLDFKENVDAESVQLSAGLQELDGIPSQTADGLDQDQVDLAVSAVLHHPLEVFHLSVVSAGRFVGIHADKDPVVCFQNGL